MVLSYSTGCLSNGLHVDGKDFIYSYTLQESQEIFTKVFDWCVENENEHTKNLIKDSILSIIDLCFGKTEEKELRYGDDEDEILCVNVLTTDKHRIRSFYDVTTDSFRLTVGIYDSEELSVKELKEILDEVVQVYYNTPWGEPEQEPEDELIQIFLQSVLSDVVEKLGKLSYTSEPCECCGDVVHRYELTI